MAFKFEKLEVWRLALDYIDLIYEIAEEFPRSEEYNLKPQMIRTATSVALNITEGSTGQNDAEQAHFLGLSIRSLMETVACQYIISRRGYLQDANSLTSDVMTRRNAGCKDPGHAEGDRTGAVVVA